jgi:hypothetical protein
MGDAEIPANEPPSATQRLLHRWFVEYNPFYLLSAMLVLVGMTALAHAAAQAGSGEGAIGEVYAFSLIAGAALLVRIRQRRPAVMLGLLTVVYQGTSRSSPSDRSTSARASWSPTSGSGSSR